MSRPGRRGPWLPEEDVTLLHLVRTQGPNNWVRISQHMQQRSPKQCRERYHQNLKPTLNHEPISAEEGEQIEQLVQEMGKRWAEIARRLGNRSDNAVKNWYNGSMNRRKRPPSQPGNVSRVVGYRTQPMPATLSHRPMYHLSAPSRDLYTPSYSAGPLSFSRQDNLSSRARARHESSYESALPRSRQDYRHSPSSSSYSPADSCRESSRRPLTPGYPVDHSSEVSGSTAYLPHFHDSHIDRYRLPPINRRDQPSLSPTNTEVSHLSSNQQAPSLISDSMSNCSISPKTLPSPRPTLPAPRGLSSRPWHEAPQAFDPKDASESNLPRMTQYSLPEPNERSREAPSFLSQPSRATSPQGKDNRMTVSSLLH